MRPDQIKNASVNDLAEWMANALATTACIGHTKGHMNETFAAQYRAELINRDKMAELGTYNGPGSF